MSGIDIASTRLLRFEKDGRAVLGLLIDDRVFPVEALVGEATDVDTSDMPALLASLPALKAHLKGLSGLPSGGQPLSQVRLLAPLAAPGTIYFAGANYWDHMYEMAESIREMTGNAPPVEKMPDPWLSVMASRSTIAGPGDSVTLPEFSTMVDWEAEIGLVIGTAAKNLTKENALDCLAGYVIANDLSARDFIKREGSPFVYDFLGQKSWDGACPIGPWLTPKEAIADPDDMSIKLWVNGELKQDSNSSQLIHNFAEILVYLSSRITLQPGDLIITGTPAGVGFPKGTFLKDGDRIRIEVGGCGVLENTMVAAA